MKGMSLTRSRDPLDGRQARDSYARNMRAISTNAAEIDALMREIARYLAAVEVFRGEGREPRWESGERADTSVSEITPSTLVSSD